MKGQTFTANQSLVAIFALIVGLGLFFLLGSIVTGAGSPLDFLCSLVGVFCYSNVNDEALAIDSTNALTCAVSAVGTGQVQPDCSSQPGKDNCASVVCCIVPAKDGGTLQWLKDKQTCQKSTYNNEQGAVTTDDNCIKVAGPKASSKACKDASGKAGQGANPGFECQTKSVEQDGAFAIVPSVSSGTDDAASICSSECDAGDCKASVGDKKYIEYDAIVRRTEYSSAPATNDFLECTCNLAGGKSIVIQGPGMGYLNDLCRGQASGSEYNLTSCTIKTVPEPVPADLNGKLEAAKGTLKACTCGFSMGNDQAQYKVYGQTADDAWKSCESDFNALKSNPRQNALSLVDQQQFLSDCQDSPGTYTMLKGDSTSPTLPSYGCKISKDIVTSCTVQNFALPQEIASSDWIRFYGDPKYLVYWQSFPIEQDTWSFKPDMTTYVAIGVLAALPWGKVGGAVTRGLMAKGIFKAGEKVATSKGVQELTEADIEAMANSGMSGGAVLTEQAAQAAVRKTVIAELAQRYLNLPSMKTAAAKVAALNYKRAAAVEATVWAADFFDSRSNDFQSMPNSVVLDLAFKPRSSKQLPASMAGTPVLVDWDPGLLTPEKIATLHFASPCKINELDVEKKTAVCDQYSFDPATGESGCSKGVSLANVHFWQKLPLIGGLLSDKEPVCKMDGYLGIDDPMLNSMDIARRTSIGSFLTQLKNKYPSELKMVEEDTSGSQQALENLNADLTKIKWVPLAIPKANQDEYMGLRVKLTENGKSLIMMDTDNDGFFDTYSVGNCRADTIVVTLPKVDGSNLPKESGKTNYCLDTRGGTGEKLAEYGSDTLLVGSFALLLVPGGGFFEIPLIGANVLKVASVGGSALQLLKAYDYYQGYWPGPGG